MTAVEPATLGIYEHRVFKDKDVWKYAVKLTVGPADARWELSAHGDDLEQVMKDIDEQRAHLAGVGPMEKK